MCPDFATRFCCAASGGAQCPTSSGNDSLDVIVPSLASGGMLTYSFSGNITGSPASITNTALVELPADTVDDSNLGNNSAGDTDLLDDLFRNGFE